MMPERKLTAQGFAHFLLWVLVSALQNNPENPCQNKLSEIHYWFPQKALEITGSKAIKKGPASGAHYDAGEKTNGAGYRVARLRLFAHFLLWVLVSALQNNPENPCQNKLSEISDQKGHRVRCPL
jgi:hypothetical protein